MSRKFLTPLVLPSDPVNPLEAATKQYVDAQTGGAGADEIWVGTTEPSDPAIELWYDPSATPGEGAMAAEMQLWHWEGGGGAMLMTAPVLEPGQVSTNTAPASATELYLSRLDSTGMLDWSRPIEEAEIGEYIYLQHAPDATSWHRYQITATPTLNGDTWTIPVTTVDGSAPGTAPPVGEFVYVALPIARLDWTEAFATYDPRYLNVAGDAMIGALTLAADPAVPLQAATKQYVDSKSAGMDQATADTRYVNVAGDTMTGSLRIANTTNGFLEFYDTANTTKYGELRMGGGGGSLTLTPAGMVLTFNTGGFERLRIDDNTITASKPILLNAGATFACHAINKGYIDTRTISTTAPLTGGGDLSTNRTLAVSAATETATGVVELATAAEATTGSDNTRAVHPAGLKAVADTKQPLDADLTAIAALAQANGSVIQSNGTAWTAATPSALKTSLSLTKTDVGLANVDNTSDANKPVSTAQQTALNAKLDTATAATTYQPLDADLTTIAGLTATTDNVIQSVGSAWASRTPAQLKTTLALTKTDVGLANVDNTADAAKPISTATQTALNLKLDTSAAFTQAAADARYAGIAHNHDSVYALLSHNHDASYLTPAAADTAYVNVAGDTMTGPLTVIGGNDVNLATADPPLMIGPLTGANMALDANEIQGRNNGVEAGIQLQPYGENIFIGAGLSGATPNNYISWWFTNGPRLLLYPKLDPQGAYEIGMQPTSMYFRLGSTGAKFNWYADGDFVAAADDPGAATGGVNVMQLSGTGVLNLPSPGVLRLDTGVAVSLASTGHPLTLGTIASANLALSTNTIQARANGANAQLNLNPLGGYVALGNTADMTFTVTPNFCSADGHGATGEIFKMIGGTTGYLGFWEGVFRRGYIGHYPNLSMTVQANTGNLRLAALAAYPIIFITNNVEAGRFDSNGNFLFNQTTASAAANGFYLGQTYSNINQINSNLNTPGLMVNKIGAGAAAGSDFCHFRWDNVTRGSIVGGASAVAYNTTSDYRLKDDRGLITDGVARVKRLICRRVHWKDRPDDEVVDGFFAHEVAEVIPEAVTGEKDAVATQEQADDEGNGLDEVGQIIPQQMDTKILIPVMVAALQELTGRIEALERKPK